MKTFKLVVLAAMVCVSAQLALAQSVWTGADLVNLNTNWSDAANWSPAAVPGAASNVLFNGTAAVAGSPFSALGQGAGGIINPANINNIVDSGFAGAISTLTYTNSNSYQNTLIRNGTLTVSNLTAGVTAEGGANNGYVTIFGTNSQLNVVNTNSTLNVGWATASSGSYAENVDLSGLGTFNANVNILNIGASTSSSLKSVGVLYLAATNIITAHSATAVNDGASSSPTLVGLNIGAALVSQSIPSFLYLGSSNLIKVNNILVGVDKQGNSASEMAFNPSLTNANPLLGPTAFIRAADGVSPVTTWAVGDGFAQR